MDDRDLRGKVVILTGASAGIGRALALELASKGARLVLAARNEPALREVAELCAARGGQAIVQRTDVREPAGCAALVARAVAELGGVDVLVHDAGISMWARFEDVTEPGIFDQLMQVNYFGPVHLTRAALPHLRRSRGRLAVVSSVAGVTGVPTRTGYAASKHAVVGFFDSLRIELAGSGVSVTILYPDFVASEMRERAFGPDGRPLGKGNSPLLEDEVMSAEECARRCVAAIARRDRELFMTPRSRVGRWLRLVAPGIVDRVAAGAIRRGR